MVKTRPKKRYNEVIERFYASSWPGCTKAYGTLNHLNAHIVMQKHGPRRTPADFKAALKELRKASGIPPESVVPETRSSWLLADIAHDHEWTRLNAVLEPDAQIAGGSLSPRMQQDDGPEDLDDMFAEYWKPRGAIQVDKPLKTKTSPQVRSHD